MDERLRTIAEKYNLLDAYSASSTNIKLVSNPALAYATLGFRNVFIDPEWDFSEIDRAQSTDSYLARSIQKKVDKFMLSGYDFIGENPQTVDYIKKRVKQFEMATKKTFGTLLGQTAQDLLKYNNAMWILVRDENKSGGRTYKLMEKEYKPIAGIFIAPFPSLQFKCQDNGDILSVRQNIGAATKEFTALNMMHFYKEKRPGYIVGAPTLYPALEDIALLRKLEEQLEELIYTCLFPLYHYKIGNKDYPVVKNPETGLSETDMLARKLSYMPSSGVYISDWRHEIQNLGAEGKALNIEYFLNHMKSRVFAAIGSSNVDFGESDSSNRSTAQTQSQMLTESVSSLQMIMSDFVNKFLITQLLMESDFKFDVLAEDNKVEIQFGKIDLNEQTLNENAAVQLFSNQAITHSEMRQKIGKKPLKEEDKGELHYNKFPDRGELAREAAAKVKPGGADSTRSANQHGTSQKRTNRDFENALNDKDSFVTYALGNVEYFKFTQTKTLDYQSRISELDILDSYYVNYLKDIENFKIEVHDAGISLLLAKQILITQMLSHYGEVEWIIN